MFEGGTDVSPWIKPYTKKLSTGEAAMLRDLWSEIETYKTRDPALRSRLDVIFSYPGFHALVFHRVAHKLWRNGFYFWGRLVSHIGRVLSGIEIHPGAKIGRGLFIDHGMGVVIGETAEVGDNVTLYQGVTLGGTSLNKGKRHPTIEDGVIVGSGAKILGPFTVGKDARVAANAVVLKEVPPGVTVVGIPARIAKGKADNDQAFEAYGTTPDVKDPVERRIETLLEEVERLSARVQALESELAEARGQQVPKAANY
jgi:serine O-acetyltransferase